MRGNIEVKGHPSIVIWTTKAITYSTSNAPSINSAVRTSQLGKTQEKRSFLRDGCHDKSIVVGVNDVRQSCIALYLDDDRWPAQLLQKMKNGMHLYIIF